MTQLSYSLFSQALNKVAEFSRICKIGILVEFAHSFNPVSFQDGM
jgi:hypothetical protein